MVNEYRISHENLTPEDLAILKKIPTNILIMYEIADISDFWAMVDLTFDTAHARGVFDLRVNLMEF